MVVAGAISSGITLASDPDLLSPFGLLFAAATLVHSAMLVGLRAYHWLLLGGLGVLSALPVWGNAADEVSLAMIPIGLAVIGLGLLDHRDLVASIHRLRVPSARR